MTSDALTASATGMTFNPLASVFRFRMHLDERRLARDKLTLIEIDDLDDVNQLVQLLDDLLYDPVISRRHDGHLRHRRIECRRD